MHLSHLDEVAWEFFGTDPAKQAVRVKVEALYPPHEVDQFTELFWKRVQLWRDHDAAERIAGAASSGVDPPRARARTKT